eukprot:2873551-Pleurochrysis_carterae.AAC.1
MNNLGPKRDISNIWGGLHERPSIDHNGPRAMRTLGCDHVDKSDMKALILITVFGCDGCNFQLQWLPGAIGERSTCALICIQCFAQRTLRSTPNPWE